VAVLLAEEAFAISLELGVLLFGDGGGIVRSRLDLGLGFLAVITAQRAATSLAV